MMSEVFELDLRAKVYGEFSKLSSEDYLGIRLNPLSSVEKVVKKQRAPLIVLKPLVESQNLTKLLSFFPGSKALWMYRHYKDVARSNLNKFGESNGIKDLRPIILNEDRNWRSEFVPDTVRHEVAKYFSEDMNPWDAAALFWYVRSSFLFYLNLADNSSVLLSKYEDFVLDPSRNLNWIYEHLRMSRPSLRTTSMVHPNSVGKGSVIRLTKPVEDLCQDLYLRLEEVHKKHSKKRRSYVQ